MKALHPGIPVSLILAATLSRIIPHPANFTPLVAIALFGTVYFNRKSTAFLAPIAAMFISDAVLWLVHGYDLFSQMRIVIYSSVLLFGGLELLKRRYPTAVTSVAHDTACS